jgi:hypothetical protein
MIMGTTASLVLKARAAYLRGQVDISNVASLQVIARAHGFKNWQHVKAEPDESAMPRIATSREMMDARCRDITAILVQQGFEGIRPERLQGCFAWTSVRYAMAKPAPSVLALQNERGQFAGFSLADMGRAEHHGNVGSLAGKFGLLPPPRTQEIRYAKGNLKSTAYYAPEGKMIAIFPEKANKIPTDPYYLFRAWRSESTGEACAFLSTETIHWRGIRKQAKLESELIEYGMGPWTRPGHDGSGVVSAVRREFQGAWNPNDIMISAFGDKPAELLAELDRAIQAGDITFGVAYLPSTDPEADGHRGGMAIFIHSRAHHIPVAHPTARYVQLQRYAF